MNKEQKPELALAAQRVKPSVDGSTFTVSMAMPVREMIAEMEKHQAKMKIGRDGGL